VTRYLVDTNVISNVTKLVPSEALVAWMAERADADVFISSPTLAEIWRDVLDNEKHFVGLEVVNPLRTAT